MIKSIVQLDLNNNIVGSNQTPLSNLCNNLKREMSQCGMEIDRVKCSNQNCSNSKKEFQITYKCNIRICEKEKCIANRSYYTRKLLTPFFKTYNNLGIFYFTFKYETLDFTDNDIVVKCRSCVYKIMDYLFKEYGIRKVIVNVDIVKKYNNCFNLHFNVACDFPTYIFNIVHGFDERHKNNFKAFTDDVRDCWRIFSSTVSDGSYRIQLKFKDNELKMKRALGYFVKRTAEVNPIYKTHHHINISIKEYARLFYKRHFITYRHWEFSDLWKVEEIKKTILVSSSNISANDFVDITKICPKCKSKMISCYRNYEEYYSHVDYD